MTDKVLIIDDSIELCKLITHFLNKDYDVTSCISGMEAIEIYQKQDFDIILLDIELPEMDGFDICQQLKLIDKSHPPSIIFHSGNDTEANVLRCFEVGGDDFIAKGAEPKLIASKIKKLIKYRRVIKNMSAEESSLNQLVDTTMMQAAFYGSALSLMSDIQLALNEHELADLIFNFMKQQRLNTAISFTNEKHELTLLDQQKQICSPIEKQVFELLKDKSRIYEFGNRTIFNDSHISVLIKNMPDKDSTEYGLLIDVLAKLVPAIEMRYRALLNAKHLEQAQVTLKNAVATIQETVVDLQNDKQKLIDDIVMKIGISFHEMDFSQDQEEFLVNLVETSVVSQANNSDKFLEVNNQLTQTLDKIHPEQQQPKFAQEAPTEDIELF